MSSGRDPSDLPEGNATGTRQQSPAAVGTMAPGTLVKDTYRILDFLGEGGAGAVYMAEHKSLGHLVAVKTLFGKFVRDEDMRRRFVEEAIIQANLNHPNIVKVVDVLDEPPLSAIFMEYVEGTSLDRHLAALGEPEPVGLNGQLFVAILDAMAYAHAQGVVHRDIKPANIMLAKAGDGFVPKVTDFGIAKVLSDHQRTETGTAMGTVYYASPEQLTDAKSVDHRADVYSLGCTFYEMLTLRLPFDDDTLFAIMRKHVQAPRPDPVLLNPEIPRDVGAAIMRAMAVNPDHRFQTCNEFAGELRRMIGLPATSGSSAAIAIGGPSTSGRIPTGAPSAISGDAPTMAPRPTPKSNPGARPRTTPGRASGRSLAGRTHPGRIDAPARPVDDRNPVARLMWFVICALAIALLAALALGGRGGDNTPAVTPDGGPDPDGGAIQVPPEGSEGEGDAAAPESSDADAGEADPDVVAIADPNRITECYDLGSQFIDFDPLGAVTFAQAIDTIESNEHDCSTLLGEHATGPFETTLAFLTTVQNRLVLLDLKARRALALNGAQESYCSDATAAVTEAHRGLRRIANTSSSDGLMPYEIQSLEPYRDRLTHVYVGLRRTFRHCGLTTVPDDLLGPEGLEPDPEPPPKEGSGEAVETGAFPGGDPGRTDVAD